MRKAKANKAAVAAVRISNGDECKAVRAVVRGLLDNGTADLAVQTARQWRGHLAALKAEKAEQTAKQAEEAASTLLAQVSFLKPAAPTVSGMAESLLRVLACMPNRPETSAAKLNAAIYEHVKNGEGFTLNSLAEQCNCSVRRVLGHLGSGKSALNGRLHEAHGLRLIVNDKSARIVNVNDKSQAVTFGK